MTSRVYITKQNTWVGMMVDTFPVRLCSCNVAAEVTTQGRAREQREQQAKYGDEHFYCSSLLGLRLLPSLPLFFLSVLEPLALPLVS